jgi:hypothetical protein
MFELEPLREFHKSIPHLETYLVFVLGFALTIATVTYLKVFVYKLLPTRYELYFLFSCVHCTGFWVTLLLLLTTYLLFGFLFEINLLLYIVSVISLVYALLTSPLFKSLQLNFWFIKNNSILPKFIIVAAYILFTLETIILGHTPMFNFLVAPLAFSLLYVVLLNIFKIIKSKKYGQVYRV